MPKKIGPTSSAKGVVLHRQSGLYRAYINVNYKQYSLGYFVAEEEALEARAKAASAFTHRGELPTIRSRSRRCRDHFPRPRASRYGKNIQPAKAPGRFVLQMSLGGVSTYIGTFDSIDEAAAARDAVEAAV